jgi:hypothetical protein
MVSRYSAANACIAAQIFPIVHPLILQLSATATNNLLAFGRLPADITVLPHHCATDRTLLLTIWACLASEKINAEWDVKKPHPSRLIDVSSCHRHGHFDEERSNESRPVGKGSGPAIYWDNSVLFAGNFPDREEIICWRSSYLGPITTRRSGKSAFNTSIADWRQAHGGELG